MLFSLTGSVFPPRANVPMWISFSSYLDLDMVFHALRKFPTNRGMCAVVENVLCVA